MVSKRTTFGDFLAGEIEFLAAHPIDGARGFQGFGRQHRGVSADESNLGLRPILFDGLGYLAIVFQRRGGGMDDDMIEIPRFLEALVLMSMSCGGQSSSLAPGTSAAGCASQVGYQKLVTSRRAW